MSYAPIALFVYKRPEHTRKTIDALIQCPEFASSPFYIFCDGAKSPEVENEVEQTRIVVYELARGKARISESEQNLGLANSIIAGVTQLCEQYGRVVVLEDDLVVTTKFLEYMNAALEYYSSESRVMQISGYMYAVPRFQYKTEAMFLPFISSWGWGTWKRAWDQFEPEPKDWNILEHNIALRQRFNLDGTYDYFTMLKYQISGVADSWAIRWYWSVFKLQGYVLYPPISYVSNIGFDRSGTHSMLLARLFLQSNSALKHPSKLDFPNRFSILEEDYTDVKKVFKRMDRLKLFVKIKYFLRLAKFIR
jgi:hypothetical protein